MRKELSLKKQLALAIKITSEVFVNIFDKGGNPYILHCFWVMNKVRHLGFEYMIVAMLHDLLEDTNYTTDQLLELGFSSKLVEYIDILTHKALQSYDEYIYMVSKYAITTEVKKRDLEHNSKITRLKGVRQKDFERIIKYNKAYHFLNTL